MKNKIKIFFEKRNIIKTAIKEILNSVSLSKEKELKSSVISLSNGAEQYREEIMEYLKRKEFHCFPMLEKNCFFLMW